MPRYGFIDESGTLDNHKVLTVALVIFEGARTAEKLHLKIVKSVFPVPKARGLAEKEKWFAAQKLHFVDMNDDRKLKLGKELGKANISAFIASYWHSDENCSHEHRFGMYKELVKATINKALEDFDELAISIAKQGGWEKYGKQLIQELRPLPEAFTSAKRQVKSDFFLASAAKPGLQIADFYASSCRNFLLADGDENLAAPYQLVNHRVRHFEQIRLDVLKRKVRP
jgi:hypothetical protein